jgi:enoyl-CoA hydratase/carnithine racemase
MINEPIFTLTLDRPEKRNALSIEFMDRLIGTLEKLDPSIRVVILEGAGEVFCAGLDLQEAQDPQKMEQLSIRIRHLFALLYSLPQLTIASMRGGAIAGGVGLLLACDFAFAVEGAHIALPEVQKGLVPAFVLALLVRKLRGSDVRELCLSGNPIDVNRAVEMGIIHRIVPMNKLKEEVKFFAKSLLKGAPKAVRETKSLIQKLSPRTLEDDFAEALKVHQKMKEHPERIEGAKAFLEKRKPKWDLS